MTRRQTSVLRGVGFRGGTFTDTTGITPLTGAPATELNGAALAVRLEHLLPGAALDGQLLRRRSTGGRRRRRTLMLTPAQYRSDAPGSLTDIQRTFSCVVAPALLQRQHDDRTAANTPALAAPPTISRVDASASGGTVDVRGPRRRRPVGGHPAGLGHLCRRHAGTWAVARPAPGRDRLDALDRRR